MDFSKINVWYFVGLCAILLIAAEAMLLWGLLSPVKVRYQLAKARYDSASGLGNEQSKAQAEQQLADAQAAKVKKYREYNEMMTQKMPVLDFTNRDVGMIAMWYEQITKLGPLLESFAYDKNVDMDPPSFTLPAPPSSPSDSLFTSDLLTFDLGNITVRGDFKSVMANIRRWNQCKRLVMVDNVSLQGTSPNLEASYSIKCYVYPTALGGPTNSMWGASTGSAGTAGGGGPMMGPGGGGMPGMSGMGGPMAGGAAAGGRPGMPMGGAMAPGGAGMPGMGGPMAGGAAGMRGPMAGGAAGMPGGAR